MGKSLVAKSLVARTIGSFAALAMVAVAGFNIAGCSHSSGGGGMGGASTAPGSNVAPSPPTSTTTPPGPAPVYGTRKCWPIVLVHGLGGFGNLGPVDYWYQIPSTLTALGFEVFVVTDTAYASVEQRAAQMQAQVLAKYPDPRTKINLIGHSMGGLDCRYAVSKLALGTKVASLTTMGSPHHGSTVADVIFGLLPGPVQDMIQLLGTLFGQNLQGASELTTSYMANVFNPGTPDVPSVSYFSWAGSADPVGKTGCIVSPLFALTWPIVNNVEGPNDGLVSTTSAMWGNYQGLLAADHINLIGQPFGVTGANFDHLKFYTEWAEKLESMGFGP